jgi:poly-beta-1,6-N-acetyl-D-glucosamine synthase
MLLIITSILLFIFYSILILFYWKSWLGVPVFYPSTFIPQIFLSVIIPARNEEKNIGGLLKALQQQTYPKELFEIIVIDDHSSDNTAAIVNEFKNARLFQLQDDAINSYKKKAMEKGIDVARGQLIVATDADCIPPAEWLLNIAACYEQTNAAFIAAPVMFKNDQSVLQIFQTLDFIVLQGITAASVHRQVHSMCNGANLAYERSAFFAVNGFDGIDQIASGDDMLLMHKISKQFAGRITYLRTEEAIVSTQPMETWKSFFNQRIRWASKATVYDDKTVMLALLIVYLFNLSFLVLLIAGWWNHLFWLTALLLLIGKTAIEFPFVYSVAKFYKKEKLMKFFILFQPLHIAYTIIAGWLGQFSTYEWKGRKVK